MEMEYTRINIHRRLEGRLPSGIFFCISGLVIFPFSKGENKTSKLFQYLNFIDKTVITKKTSDFNLMKVFKFNSDQQLAITFQPLCIAIFQCKIREMILQ